MRNLSELAYLQTQRNHFYNNNMEAELTEVLAKIEEFTPEY